MDTSQREVNQELFPLLFIMDAIQHPTISLAHIND